MWTQSACGCLCCNTNALPSVKEVFTPSPVIPSQICNAVPTPSADLCTRLTRFFNIAGLLCDFFSWFLNPNGTISDEVTTELATQLLPPGVIVYALGNDLGSGWLLCDGSQVSRTTYANLFAVIGTRYGSGDGSTTFTLPDLRGRSPIGEGTGSQGGALTNRSISTKYIGEESHAQTEAELAPHTHTINAPTSRTEERGDGANVVWRSLTTEETESTGGGQPFNVVHPCLIAYGFVKT